MSHKNDIDYYKVGVLFDKMKNIEGAITHLKIASKRGSIKAKIKLGDIYSRHGINSKEYKKSKHWYKKAAIKGDKIAQFNYGAPYINKKNHNTGVAWLVKSANQGYIRAQHRLGMHYISNKIKDYHEAYKWFQKSADQGDADSQYRLAHLCRIFWDRELSEKWFKKSADQGHFQALYNLGKIYRYVKKDYKMAFDLFQLSLGSRGLTYKSIAYETDFCTFYELGLMYKDGLHVKQDHKKAHKHFTKSKNKRAQVLETRDCCKSEDENYSLHELGIMWENGFGCESNFDKAKHWYTESYNAHNRESAYNIGMMYYNGVIVPKDIDMAMEWFEKSANNPGIQRYKPACTKLGDIYYKRREYGTAFDYYKIVTFHGSDFGFSLGKMYYHGHGIDKDHEKASFYINHAAENGYSKAIKYLKKLTFEGER